MGYNTVFTLNILDKDNKQGDLDLLRGEPPITVMHDHSLVSMFEDYDMTQYTWYDHEKDMRRVSEMYPDLTFILYGDGDGAPMDLWCKIFKAGRITYQHFVEDSRPSVDEVILQGGLNYVPDA